MNFNYMKSKPTIAAALLAATLIGLSGCESMKSASEGVREGWAARYEGRSKVFPATQKECFIACKKAFEKMDFRFTKGGAAQGKLEAVGALHSDAALRGSRQLGLKVTLTKVPDGTEVKLLVSEFVEDSFEGHGGMGTETPIKDSPLYDLYLAQVADIFSRQASNTP